MKSLSYYLTLFVIRIKGLKKTFETTPIDYIKLRKQNILSPKNKYFKKQNIETFNILNSTITEISTHKKTTKLILFVHGGAFVYGPEKYHWDTIEKISKQTNHTIWMVDYPKAPEHKISEISKNIDEVYSKAIAKFGSENIFCIGDSVGGTLLITLTQRLIIKSASLPAKLVLISPVIHAAFNNPDIVNLDKEDPILSKKGVLSAKLMCSDNENLNDPLISPIQGSFDQFPETILYAATNDITFPDQLFFIQKIKDENITATINIGEGMPHIWPFLPVMKEAKTALQEIIAVLKQ